MFRTMSRFLMCAEVPDERAVGIDETLVEKHVVIINILCLEAEEPNVRTRPSGLRASLHTLLAS